MNNRVNARRITQSERRITQSELSAGSRNARRKYGGRKPGTPNRLTQELKDAVIQAAERVGSDLRGKDGLIGYLMRVGQKDTKAFGALLRAVLPLHVNLEAELKVEKSYSTLEECEAAFRESGNPMPFWLPALYKGELKALAEQLEKELSLEVKLLAIK
jgi:hypothetical protein